MEIKWSEKLIQRRLWFHFLNHRYRFINIFFFGRISRYGECDFLSFFQSGYCQEVEIKISKSDFRADFKKEKHEKMKRSLLNLPFMGAIPNRFYYAVPRGLIKSEDVPNYAGLIYIGTSSNDVVIVKKAPLIHKEKIDYLMAFNKTYYSYQDTTTIRLREF